MMNFDMTGFFVLTVLIVSLVYDLYQYRKPAGTTISTWVREMSSRNPIIPFLTGVVCGHLFWYN